MKIKINGEEFPLDKEITVEELLVWHKVEMPEYVTVQINEEILERQAFPVTEIHDGDEIEFLYYMGGGMR